MPDDYSKKIRIVINSAPVQLDEENQLTNKRFVLGYLTAVYAANEDLTVKIHVKKNESMDFEEAITMTLTKDKKREYKKLPLIGSIIDFFVSLESELTEFELTSLKVSHKIVITGKH